MNTTIYASFLDIDDAERATGALLDHGVKASEISLIAHERYADRMQLAADGLGPDVAVAERGDLHGKTGITTTTSQDASSGAVKGAEVGLGVGVLSALAAVFLPGFGLVLGGGALALALTGAAATTGAGAIAGGALGFMKDQGVPADVVENYTKTYDNGGAVLAVSVLDESKRAEIQEVLSKYNARDLNGYQSSYLA